MKIKIKSLNNTGAKEKIFCQSLMMKVLSKINQKTGLKKGSVVMCLCE